MLSLKLPLIISRGNRLVIQVDSSAAIEIDLMASLKGILTPPINLANQVDDAKQRQQDVGIYKITGVKGRECRPTLDNGQEDASTKSKPRGIGVPHGLVRQLLHGSLLNGPGTSESNMDQADASPNEEGTDSRKVDNIAVGLGGTGGDVHHGDGTDGIGDENGPDRDTTAVGPSEDSRGFARLSHVENGS